MATTRTLTLAMVGALAVTVTWLIVTAPGEDARDRTEPASSTASPGATHRPRPARTRRPTPTPEGSHAPTPTAPHPSTPAPPLPSSAGGPTQPSRPGDVLPTLSGGAPATEGTSTPSGPATSPTPLLGDTPPEPATATGRLVAGFPDALAPPAGATIESSSVSVTDDVVRAEVVMSHAVPQRVIAHYRSVLVGRGYAERPAGPDQDRPAAAFSQGEDTVTVTTVDGAIRVVAMLHAATS